jgi:hypothetical protein
MVGQQRSARRRDEGGQPLQQLERLEQQRRGAVAPRASQLVQELPARALRQPLQRQGRTHDVAAQLLQLVPATRGHRHVRMETEALEPRRTPPGRRRGGGRAEPAHRLPGAEPERNPPLQRGGDGAREQRLLHRKRITPRLRIRPPPAAAQQAPHAALHPREQDRDVGVGGRRQAVEHGSRRGRGARVAARRPPPPQRGRDLETSPGHLDRPAALGLNGRKYLTAGRFLLGAEPDAIADATPRASWRTGMLQKPVGRAPRHAWPWARDIDSLRLDHGGRAARVPLWGTPPRPHARP